MAWRGRERVALALEGASVGNNTVVEIGSLQNNNVVLETSFSFELNRLSMGFAC